MFGIGGGFLMTPLLIFVGIAPAVAVASVASHIAASSFSAPYPTGAAGHRSGPGAGAAEWRTIGTALGVWTFTLLRSLGQLDLLIALSYVILLSTVGGLMFWEGLRAILRARRGVAVPMRRSGSHGWIHGLPLKMRFKRSKIYLSVIPVVRVGLIIGFIGAVMGIGGGFILIPIMIICCGCDLYRDRHLDGADAGHHGVRHHAACGHQPSRRCGAGADSDGRRCDRRAVRRPRRPEDSRRTSAAAAWAC